MQVIDLSHTLETGMPVYPGTEPPTIDLAATIGEQGYLERRLTLWSHTGTHLDAPAHVIPAGATLTGLDPGTFVGQAFCVECTGLAGAEIGIDQVRAVADRLAGQAFCLLQTGWSHLWGTSRYYRDYPVLSEEAARWLAQSGLRGVGIDTISVDRIDSESLPAHRVLLGAGLVIVENLTNLAALPRSSFLFSCLPLKIASGDGSPVRAVAIL